MPKMHKNASSEELKKSLEDHMKETENQIKRIEDCFKELGKKPQAAVCDAMKGLLEEGKGINGRNRNGCSTRCRNHCCSSKNGTLRNCFLWYTLQHLQKY